MKKIRVEFIFQAALVIAAGAAVMPGSADFIAAAWKAAASAPPEPLSAFLWTMAGGLFGLCLLRLRRRCATRK
jgi:hypothetical protein